MGDAAPASIEVDTFESGVMDDDQLARHVAQAIDFRSDAIADRLRLGSLPTERGGHFCRDLATDGQMGRTDLTAP